ncbi:MAG: DUF2231 domain-containing protein [Micromonosporaceae bacterium]|jgi:uncharacterized membrane protein|nr:DUF2231 domain-containing protein [Micromonosporaceae bacterium]
MGGELRPVLVATPPGLLLLAALFDTAGFIGGWPFFGAVGFWVLAAGAAASAVASLLGLADLFALPVRSAARRSATTYGLVHIWSLGLLALVWLARAGTEHHRVGAGKFLVELLGFAGIGVARWHGSPVPWRDPRPSRSRS